MKTGILLSSDATNWQSKNEKFHMNSRDYRSKEHTTRSLSSLLLPQSRQTNELNYASNQIFASKG